MASAAFNTRREDIGAGSGENDEARMTNDEMADLIVIRHFVIRHFVILCLAIKLAINFFDLINLEQIAFLDVVEAG
jgi:hypothetical protein